MKEAPKDAARVRNPLTVGASREDVFHGFSSSVSLSPDSVSHLLEVHWQRYWEMQVAEINTKLQAAVERRRNSSKSKQIG